MARSGRHLHRQGEGRPAMGRSRHADFGDPCTRRGLRRRVGPVPAQGNLRPHPRDRRDQYLQPPLDRLARKPTIAATVAAGCSSISQLPELATTWPATLLATKRRTSAIAVPNDLSAPIASTGMVSFSLAANALLSMASWVKAANCSNAECMAPGR